LRKKKLLASPCQCGGKPGVRPLGDRKESRSDFMPDARRAMQPNKADDMKSDLEIFQTLTSHLGEKWGSDPLEIAKNCVSSLHQMLGGRCRQPLSYFAKLIFPLILHHLFPPDFLLDLAISFGYYQDLRSSSDEKICHNLRDKIHLAKYWVVEAAQRRK